MYLIGYDIGSSSIKAALVDIATKKAIEVVQSPSSEMEIQALESGWAEQNPEIWWENVCQATQSLLAKTKVQPADIQGVGIAYQMHGLVFVDRKKNVLRPSIIWCDSRAVEIGNNAFTEIGQEKCLREMLNSPGNFTASKLKWVKENEPEIFSKIYKMMLPGDFIVMKFTDKIGTTASGLSEGILWDFQKERIANTLLEFYKIDEKIIPDIHPTFSIQGKITASAAAKTGLKEGTPICYRAGDQPNNAMSLDVLEPGEIAATGGTSGVVYGVLEKPTYDVLSRVNAFAHVNHTTENPRIGILLNINGAGIQYSWMKKMLAEEGMSYLEMEKMANTISIGSDRLRVIPFGNGSERMLENKNVGAQVNNLQFNRHGKAHFYRATLEGIAFSFVYGMKILKEMGMKISLMRVGNDNLFQSKIFSQTIANLIKVEIKVVKTTGAIGAAKAAGLAINVFSNIKEAMSENEEVLSFFPEKEILKYEEAFQIWEKELEKLLSVN